MAPNGVQGEVPPKTILAFDNGNRIVMWSDLPGYVVQSESFDGGLAWSPERKILGIPDRWGQPAVIRSPDGKQLLMLLRENGRQYQSLFSISNDNAATWSEPLELPAELTGDRHVVRYAPDGRLVVAMRDMSKTSKTYGHYVAWVGRYEDIVEQRAGQYRIKLLHNCGRSDADLPGEGNTDCGYSDLEVLPDGTIVATTYIKYQPGPEKNSVVNTRFKLDEIDKKLDAMQDPSIEILYNGVQLPAKTAGRTDMMAYGDAPLPVPYLDDPPKVIPVNIGRQLFVDDFLIDNTTLTWTWHKAEKDSRNPILQPSTPQELGTRTIHPWGGHSSPMAAPFSDGVWYDGADKTFKMWYCAGWLDGMAYASSSDGLTWTRPELDVEPGTNLVIPRVNVRDSGAVVLDPDAARNEERFKMFLYHLPKEKELLVSKQGGELYVSKDGLHWSKPVETGETGDRTTIFYNPFRKKWIYSLRAYWPARSRNYSESSDFLGGAAFLDAVPWLRTDNLDIPEKHWFYAFPDRRPGQGGDKPQLYNFDAVAYESLMLGAFTILLGPDNASCEAEGVPKLTEIHLGFSRDGYHWSRPSERTPFIPASRTEGTWDRAYLHSNAALCLVMKDELWFYYTGFKGDPERKGLDAQSNGLYATGSTGIARLRRDGFASMDAGQEEGVLTTRPIVFAEGSHLFVNANTAKGELYAEVLAEDGKVIKGFSSDQCKPLSADSTCMMIRWKGWKKLSALQGRPIRLRFHLKNGELYAFWIASRNGASHGYLAGGGPGYDSLRDEG